jgi:hypothetical protein
MELDVVRTVAVTAVIMVEGMTGVTIGIVDAITTDAPVLVVLTAGDNPR